MSLLRKASPGAIRAFPSSASSKCQPTNPPSTKRSFSYSSALSKQRLVILGSGWAGYTLLQQVDRKKWDVTLVSANTYFAFTPLLAQTAVGTLEFRTALEPVRRYSPQVTAFQAWCDRIDFKRKQIECVPATPPLPPRVVATPIPNSQEKQDDGKSPFYLPYDYLVIAVGAYSQTFNIPGVKEHALFLKDVKDARAIRSRTLECFEQASQPTLTDVERRRLLHFPIVGGGPTGVEFAAELHDLLTSDMKRNYPALAPLARIVIYDVAPQILQSFDSNLVEYAVKKFGREGITIKTGHHVTKVNPGSLEVQEEGEIPFGMLIWSTGLAPNPLVAGVSDLEKDPKSGMLITDDHLRVLDKETGEPLNNVFAIGDSSTIKDKKLPATAQVASQEARYLAKTLNKIVRERPAGDAFKFHNRGSLAYLGDWNAIYDRTQVEDGGPKGKESGRLAWLLWRSAYFSMTLSMRNKILVPFYWFFTWIFGRDVTRF